jgi:AAA domain
VLTTAVDRLVAALESHGSTVRQTGIRVMAQCPSHKDRKASLSLTQIEGSVLVCCHANCATIDVLAALGLTLADLYDNRRGIDYRYDNGRTVHRYANKQFAQSDTTNTPELYRLARVRAAVAADEWLWVVEGEKDVHVLATLGVTATCNPMGAGQWSGIDPSPLYGASRVVIVADRDEPGMRHAREIFASLTGHVTDLQVVQAREGKDAADHVVAGYGLEDFDPVDLGEIRASPAADPLYVDIGALIDGGLPDPPAPSVLARADGVCAFYAGEVNMLFGEPETGKTWIALVALAEVLTSGGSGLVVDLDHNGAVSTITRLLALGVPEEILIDATRFRYAEPEEDTRLDEIVRDSRAWRPAVAVVDSVGELMPLLRLSSNSPDDYTTAHCRVLKPLARTGAAVIAIDHLAKNENSRRQGATGTAAKRRAIGGTSLRVELVDSFVPGRGGACALRIHKDRHGGLRARCPSGGGEAAAGVFQMTDRDGLLTWTFHAPQQGDSYAESGVPGADIEALDSLDPPPKSQRDVKSRMDWGSGRALAALRAWRQERSRSAPPEQGAHAGDNAPCSTTPMSRSEEQPKTRDLADLAPFSIRS